MNVERVLVISIFVLFMIAAVLSGPAVSDLTFTPDRPTEPTVGHLSVSDAEVVNSTVVVRYDRERGYYVTSPTVKLNVSSVQGRPVLNYLAKSSGSRFFWTLTLSYPREPRELSFGGERKQVPDWVATNQSYSGQVRVVVRGSDGRRVLLREPIEIVVSPKAANEASSEST